LCEDVIFSGFFDSIGLSHWHKITQSQKDISYQWATIFGIVHFMKCNFLELSQGQQRLALLARAMVKLPILLILDEPCHGLDIHNRKKFVDMVDNIGSHSHTNIIYITHHDDEVIKSASHKLVLNEGRIKYMGLINEESEKKPK